MAEQVSGFELPEGAAITDLEHWQPFAGWYQREYGFAPSSDNPVCTEIFEAFLAGAYWESQRAVETK